MLHCSLGTAPHQSAEALGIFNFQLPIFNLLGTWDLIIGYFKMLVHFGGGRKEGRTSSQHGPYTLGYTHPTMAKNKGLQARKSKLIPEISSQFGLESETRLHEVGIGSNRGSAGRGEYVIGSCTN